MPAPFTSDRTWTFEAMNADEVWQQIGRAARDPDPWPWVRTFDPGAGLVRGAVWRCVVAPPLPYVVRLSIHIDEIVPRELVSSRVDGDIAGTARLTFVEDERGVTARLQSRLTPSSPALRALSVIARPVVEWGHSWVLERGGSQFVRRVLVH